MSSRKPKQGVLAGGQANAFVLDLKLGISGYRVPGKPLEGRRQASGGLVKGNPNECVSPPYRLAGGLGALAEPSSWLSSGKS